MSLHRRIDNDSVPVCLNKHVEAKIRYYKPISAVAGSIRNGLYCGDCGAWLKWPNKQERQRFDFEISEKLSVNES